MARQNRLCKFIVKAIALAKREKSDAFIGYNTFGFVAAFVARLIFKKFSRRLGVYNTIHDSKIYYKILKYKNPNYFLALDEDLAFYCRALEDYLDLVFDVGANRDDKTWAFRHISENVACIDTDKTRFAALLSRYGKNKGVQLENVAVGDRSEVGTFL